MSTPLSTPPVKSSEEYFNSSRLKVIGLITAATVAVGALGGIAGVAFDPDPVPKDHVIQPGGEGGTRLAPQSLGGPGNSSPRGHAARSSATSRVPSSDATSTPSSVGSVSPGSGGFTDSPEDTPTESPSDGGTTGGTGAVIEDTGVQVFVPPGWEVYNSNSSQVYLQDGNGNFAFAFSYADDPATAAGDVLTQNLDNILPADLYTQRQTSDVQALDPFGSVVSLAGIEYEALWVDNQGSVSIHGQIYVGVRQDGTVLGIEIEHAPAEDFEDSFEDLTPILDETFGRFGGLG
jgi:hypothetical protein